VLLLIGGIIQLIVSVTVLGIMIALLNQMNKRPYCRKYGYDASGGQICHEDKQLVVLVFGISIAFFLISGALTDVRSYARYVRCALAC
jgi:hypothetical protein